MTAIPEMGGIILPPVPAFQLHPSGLDEIAAQIATRAVDLFRLVPPCARACDPPA